MKSAEEHVAPPSLTLLGVTSSAMVYVYYPTVTLLALFYTLHTVVSQYILKRKKLTLAEYIAR